MIYPGLFSQLCAKAALTREAHKPAPATAGDQDVAEAEPA